jgi:hypothetical protein
MTLDDSDVETSDFFNGLANRLVEKRFDIQRQVRSDPYILDLYAVGPGIPRGKGTSPIIVILGIGIPAATVSGVSAFSSFAMRYIMENKKTLNISPFDLDVLPVIAAEGFTPEVITWVSENRPAHKAIMDGLNSQSWYLQEPERSGVLEKHRSTLGYITESSESGPRIMLGSRLSPKPPPSNLVISEIALETTIAARRNSPPISETASYSR